MKNFVDINWLRENLSSEKLIVIDTRGELDSKEIGYDLYRKGHLKGARYMSLDDHMTGPIEKHGGRHPLVDVEKFKGNLEEMGVSDDSTLVIYDDGSLPMASRLWYLLRYIGKDRIYILKGGYQAIVDGGLDLDHGDPGSYERGSLNLKLDASILADIAYVKSHLDSGKALVDSRSRERYDGIEEPIDRIAGHIPGAINYPWMEAAGLAYDIDRIKEHFSRIGGEDIVVHCGSGVTGCVNFIFMEEVGLKPRLYLGGYSDWISYEDNQIAKS